MRKLIFTIISMLFAILPNNVFAQFPTTDFDAKYGATLPKKDTDAPQFSMKTIDGKNFKLSQLKGKYVVLDFWASWCPDCLKDAPEVSRMAKAFKSKGVEFVGVSMDTDKEAWKAAIEKYDLNYTQVSELKKFKETDISKSYGVNWIPSMVLINPQGKIVLSTVEWYKMERTLTELFPNEIATVSEQVVIDGALGKLRGELVKPASMPQGKTPVAVLLHGFGGHRNGDLFTSIVDSLASKGIPSVRFDFNGHGESDGDFVNMTVPNEIEDAKAILKYVRSLPFAGDIALIGHSQGGVVASMLAGEMPEEIKAVALLAPAAVLRDDAIRGSTMGKMYDPQDLPEYVELWGGKRLGRAYMKTAFSLPIYETAAGYKGKALIVHGLADRVVPYTYGERYHDLWKPQSQLVLMPAFDHGFSQNVYRVAQITADFIAKELTKNN